MRKQLFNKGDRVWNIFKGRGTITKVIKEKYIDEPHYEIDYDNWDESDIINKEVIQHVLRPEKEYEERRRNYEKKM